MTAKIAGTSVIPVVGNTGWLKALTGTTTKKKSGAGKKDSSPKQSAPAPAVYDEDLVYSYANSLYSAANPQKVVYEAQSEAALREQIVSWLRPAYEQAIAQRKKLTEQYRAELDADAISRGMGGSTYVTDVKGRQSEAEAEDIAGYETDYAAQLAKHLSEALDTEKERALNADLTNSEREHEAYMQAYSAALTLFTAYKSASAGSPYSRLTETAGGLSSAEDVEAYLSSLSAEERGKLYGGGDAGSRALRNGILGIVGSLNFLYLQQQYPGA